MTRTDAPGAHDRPATNGLLAWMGLPADAGHDEVEGAHERLVQFLDEAPPELRAWARQQVAAAEAALLLTDRPAPVDPSTPTAEPDESTEDTNDRTTDGDTDGADDVTAIAVADTGIDPVDEAMDQEDFEEDDDSGPRRTRPVRAKATQGRNKRLRVLVLAALIVGVIIGVYQMGGPPAQSSPTAGGTAPAGHGQAKQLNEDLVKQLKAQVDRDPKNTVAMKTLGEAYFQASDFSQAALWQQRILDVDPRDVDARLAAGVALFNLGDVKGAESHFQKAVEVDPNRAEVHYNLGFLYLSQDPPDLPKAEKAWGRAIEIDPNSPLAKNAKAHLDRLKKQAGPTPAAPSTTAAPAAAKG